MRADSRPDKPDNKLDNIQLLRAIAASMVAFLHLDHIGTINPLTISHGYAHFSLIPLSYGVDIFFIISGFIITISSSRDIANKNIKIFLIKRAIRIIPLYWSALTIFIFAKLCKLHFFNMQDQYGKLTFESIITSYFFIPYDGKGYGSAYPFPIIDLGWTLNYEVFFYLIFALCMTVGSKWFFRLSSSIIIFCVLLMQFIPELPLPFSFWFQPIIFEFLSGIILALVYRSGIRINQTTQIIFFIVGLSIWILLPQNTFGPVPLEARGSYSWPRIFSAGAGALCIMIAATLAQKQISGNLAKIGNALGASSYTLYLTHIFTIMIVQILLKFMPFVISWHWQYSILLLIISIAIAHALYIWFERPVTTWLNNSVRSRLL